MASTVGTLMTDVPMRIGVEDPLYVAEAVMLATHARHWPVVKDRSLAGVLSLRDILTVHRSSPADRGRHEPELPNAGQLTRHAGVQVHPRDDLAAAAEVMNRHRLWCLPVVHKGELVGIVTLDHIVQHAVMMLRQEEYEFRFAPIVARLMTASPLVAMQMFEPVDTAQELMRTSQVRHLVVMMQGQLVGIVSERDVLEALRSRRESASTRLVAEIMSTSLETTTWDTDAATAGELLVAKNIGALPVLRSGRVVGILCKSDYLRYVVAMTPPAATPRTHNKMTARPEVHTMFPTQIVLIVEDDTAILSSLAEVMREDGFVVDTATNGYQALAQMEACEPDLIFLDLMMPQMDGWRFVAEVRARFPSRQVPIVLVSAAPNLAAEASKLGVSSFLRKPFDLQSVTRITQQLSSNDQEAG